MCKVLHTWLEKNVPQNKQGELNPYNKSNLLQATYMYGLLALSFIFHYGSLLARAPIPREQN